MNRKHLVIDANILIRAVLGTKVFALLDTFAGRVVFVTAQVAFNDAAKYLPGILAKRGFPPEKIDLALATLTELTLLVTPFPEEVYKAFEGAAKQRLGGRDEEDWPFMALALHLGCPLWTEDRDFFGSGVATWTSDRVHLYLEA